mmetsp:Transcript_13897/g.23133  ORF Transcript_13897/g.23133 Transcript_13897/m.23133 type:complete len:88 (+) Transcript_13897:32-295(+)
MHSSHYNMQSDDLQTVKLGKTKKGISPPPLDLAITLAPELLEHFMWVPVFPSQACDGSASTNQPKTQQHQKTATPKEPEPPPKKICK